MKMTFRWFGEGDSIPLKYIRQIPGVTGVVTAVYGVPPGEVWGKEEISRLKSLCAAEDLEMEVIESVPVAEEIKLGLPAREGLIKNYAENLRRLGRAGVKCVCYNFMPVFDWVRTDLKKRGADGSFSLSYEGEELAKQRAEELHLPGWDESYRPEELRALLNAYEGVSEEGLFDNLVYFLQGVLPAAEEAGITMAIHPDDPPWGIFGLPRVVTTEENLDRLFAAVPHKNNGLTFCTGSLGARRESDLVRMAEKYAKAGRIFFAHLRQIRFGGASDFTEAGHLTASGSLDMKNIVNALVRGGFRGYVRPDHGRDVWGESGKPGYGLYDRAMGACYLNGLFEQAEHFL